MSLTDQRRHATDPPRGRPYIEVHGWLILSCQDARYSWVEVTTPSGPVEMAPGIARDIAQALIEVATNAGDSAVKRFVESPREEFPEGDDA